MRNTNRMISGVAGLMVIGLVSFPDTVAASNANHSVANVANGRLQATFDGWSDSTGRKASAGIRMERAGMAYRFRVDAVDSTGRLVALPPGWDVTFRGGATELRTLLSLSLNAIEIDLPRPLGIRIAQADSIEIVASWTDASMSGITLLVSVDYDPMDSRLSVRPVGLSEAGVAGSAVRQWDLTPTESGRLLAIAGLPVAGLVSISLVDASNGSTLWQSAASSSFGAPRSVARLGVAVQGGRAYRIVATFAGEQATTVQSVVAMILPTR